jgi:uncharacterized BrkB/YihY/UPF0761 family membrane protein
VGGLWRPRFPGLRVLAERWGLLRIPVALLLLSLVVSAVYRFATNANPPLRSVVPGAFLAVALWALASLAFAFGLTLFPSFGAVYGSLGAAISLLLYLYVSAAALLLGAEVNAAMLRKPLSAAILATRITSSEVMTGTCTPKPCATNLAPTKIRITARP